MLQKDIKRIEEIIDRHFQAYFGSDYTDKDDIQPNILFSDIMREIKKKV